MNWAIGIDTYTLMCVKLMTNKNLLYKRINKIKKFKKKKDFKIRQAGVKIYSSCSFPRQAS